jgi:hypothetical protein
MKCQAYKEFNVHNTGLHVAIADQSPTNQLITRIEIQCDKLFLEIDKLSIPH